MELPDTDEYFGREVRHLAPTTRRGKADALSVYFQFLELRHAIEIHNLTGIVVQCPLDELNRQRGSHQLRILPPRPLRHPQESPLRPLHQAGRRALAPLSRLRPGRTTTGARSLPPPASPAPSASTVTVAVKWQRAAAGDWAAYAAEVSRRTSPQHSIYEPGVPT